MYVDTCKYKRGERTYKRSLLRHGYREDGKVKHKTIANLSHFSDVEIESLKIALSMKNDIAALKKLASGQVVGDKVVGPVAALYQVANELGITKALGQTKPARLVLWLIFARLIEQGSRLSAVRLAQTHAACEILGLESFNEDDMYKALDWLDKNQKKIEQRLFEHCTNNKTGSFFLYDVTSSYFEGDKNELAAYGYNRDKKKGKKQVVYGLLSDENGEPVSISAFDGNTKDNKTLHNQLSKLKDRFNCKHITIVGDKGMIKSTQIDEIKESEFCYITTITKPQIRELLRTGTIQFELFESDLCEIFDAEKNIRYIFRRNPLRVKEIKENRDSKIESIKNRVKTANTYLENHKRAKAQTQFKDLSARIKKYKIHKFVSVEADEAARKLTFHLDEDALETACKLDGCYVIKTDMPKEDARKELIHDRYKSLAEVEWSFRTSKTGYLEARPIFVCKSNRTRAHLFVVMLAYKIEKHLRNAWSDLDLTVEEGVKSLSTITSVIVTIGDEEIIRVVKPNKRNRELLERIDVMMPEALPRSQSVVATRKKLNNSRKKRATMGT